MRRIIFYVLTEFIIADKQDKKEPKRFLMPLRFFFAGFNLSLIAEEKYSNGFWTTVRCYDCTNVKNMNILIDFWKMFFNGTSCFYGAFNTIRVTYPALSGIIYTVLCVRFHHMYCFTNRIFCPLTL
mgnify:CR=1 FL=1